MKKRILALLIVFFLTASLMPGDIISAALCAAAEEAPAEEVPPEEQPSDEEKPEEEEEKKQKKSKLKVTIKSKVKYVFADEDAIPLKITIKGGVAPYTLTLKVNGDKYESMTVAEACTQTIKYTPKEGGDFNFKAVVKDSKGKKVTAKVTVPVAVRDREYESTWKKTMSGVRLTGDWRADLVNIASTQLGYEESGTNFIVDDNGKKQGYTRYGEWYGSTYAGWCGMFISFCLAHADIGPGEFPREANPSKWKSSLKWMGSYMDDEDAYVPQKGDLIFFNYNEENAPEHMGIVASVGENAVYTIEGNNEKEVRRCSYPLDDERIVGYSSTVILMEKAGAEVPRSKKPEIPDIPAEGVSALSREAGVVIYSDANTQSTRIVTIDKVGSDLTVKSACAPEDDLWYFVEYEKWSGYIKADLLFLQIKE